MALKKTKGILILKQIESDEVYERTVHICNDNYGKVTLPGSLIGKQVYVLVKPDKK